MKIIAKTCNLLLGFLLRLRYRINVQGLSQLEPDGRPILFLPNHPSLIDPVIIMHLLLPRFAPCPLANAAQVDKPLLRGLMHRLGAIIIPDLSDVGRQGKQQVEEGLDEAARALEQGRHLLLYPAGRLMRSGQERVGANSGVAALLALVPEVRVILIRTTGLYGSSFSRAQGTPSLVSNLLCKLWWLPASLLFFMPKRDVGVAMIEPPDFPRKGGRMEINGYLEAFYNREATGEIRVPYHRFQKLPAARTDTPAACVSKRQTAAVPPAVRAAVMGKLHELAGTDSIGEEDHLAQDLAMDSLILVEFAAWLEETFNVRVASLEVLETVQDCLLAAAGMMAGEVERVAGPAEPAWFSGEATVLHFGEGATITDRFLAQARANPDRILLADEMSGTRTNRELILAVMALQPQIRRIKAPRVAIMMPASVAAAVAYLALLFAGKEPVLVNWTTGSGQVRQCLELVGVQEVITSRQFVSRLQSQGFAHADIGVNWLYLEQLSAAIGRRTKIGALLRSRLSWRSLAEVQVPVTAAILFTSGSETAPKAVPLSHGNILANGRDVTRLLGLRHADRLLGILPVFHSLGLVGTVILPLCTGLRTVYSPNPNEGKRLAALIDRYRVSTMITTPTFLQNILRNGTPDQLASLRLIFSGAEACPRSLRAVLEDRIPHVAFCEGYGVTECSPVICVNSPEESEPGTIGRLLPSMEMVLLDAETGEALTGRGPGRLLVRGPNVFAGYLGEARTPFVEYGSKVWYDTGDLVEHQENGHLRFAGRLKRFVKIGGEMISLPAIEQSLLAERAGEEGPVFAVLATGKEGRQELLLASSVDIECRQANEQLRSSGLSALHRLARVVRVPSIPILGTGKTDYRALAALVDNDFASEGGQEVHA